MTALRPLALVAATVLSCLASTAHAGDPERGFRLGATGSFGFGGKVEVEVDNGGTFKDDLEATVGFGLFGTYPVHRHFHIGLRTTFGWVTSEDTDTANGDSTMVIDISPVLKARVPLMHDKLELYAIFPIGLTISVPPDDSALGTLDTGVGWNVGLQFGASYLVTDAIGLLAEIGWQGRSATNSTSSGTDLTFTMHQFALNFGAYYVF
jgi:hypothetical protein